MSNFLAIATVSAALRRLVFEGLQADVSGAEVTTRRPDQPGAASGIPTLGVNLFLYQVVPNPPLRNTNLPARRNGGSLIQRPVAALELHYLFSFYGDDAQYEPQRLMGSTIAKLQAEPLLTRKRISDTIADAGVPFLSPSDLGDQVDSIKFTPLSLSLEEMSRVWSVFFQTKYALSMGYRASAVLIEPQLTVTPSLPVREPLLQAMPIRRPVLLRIVASPNEEEVIVAGGGIALIGEQLRAEDMEVLVEGTAIAPTLRRDERIELTLPSGLRAGPRRVQIQYSIAMGKPPALHPAYQSNPAEFVLHPAVAKVGPNYQVAVSNITGVSPNPRSADVHVTLTDVVSPEQQVTLELLSQGEVVRTFFAKSRTADSTAVAFALSNVPPAIYVVRLRVDGAETPMEIDETPGSATFGQPRAPAIDLT